MPLSRRDTIKAAGAAGAIGLIGGQVSAQQVDEEEENGEPTEALEEGEAAVRVAHLSSDSPEIDIAIDGETLFDSLAYGDVTEYERGNAGEYPIEIMATADENILLFEDEFDLEEQTFYTFAVFGEFRADDLEIEMLEDFNESQVRFVHASPDAPDVDIDADDEGLFSDVGFGDTTEYMAVPPGQYTLEVEGADEDLTGDDEETMVAQVEDTVTMDATLEGGVAYTIWAVGYIRPPGENEVFDVLLTTDGATADREADIQEAEPEPEEEPEEPEEEPDEEEPDEEEPDEEEPDDEPEEEPDEEEPEEPDDEPEEPDDEPDDEDDEPA